MLLLEISTSPETLTDYSDSRGMPGFLNSDPYCEELLELKDKLHTAFWKLVDSELTVRQREVLHLTAEGLTQTEIAKKLGVNQSSITKSIHGNTDYKKGKRVYGGARKKLVKLITKDAEIQDIFHKISELDGND
jgi:DNA-binding CsgD family transcriptional regulator